MATGQSPKYVSIATKLTSAIESGRYAPGDRLPAESKLADEYRATVPTVRRAMALLRSQNLIESRQGVGTFVRNLSSSKLSDAEGASTDDPETERAQDQKPWPRHLRSFVEVVGSDVFCTVRYEATSLTLSRVVRALYMPLSDRLAAADESAFSEALADADGGAQVFRIARPTDGVEAELLGLVPGAPVLSIVQPLGESRILDIVYPGDTLVPGRPDGGTS